MDYTLLLGVPRAVPPSVIADSPLAGADGWIWPDPETGGPGFERVYAISDCTAIENLPKGRRVR